MASYKDTAEMEYTAKDNLSSSIKSINNELQKQQDKVAKTQNKLDQYQVELDELAATYKKTESALSKYTTEVTESRAKLTESKIAQQELARETKQLQSQFNQLTKTLNNLTNEQREDIALVERLTNEHKQYYTALNKADAALLKQKQQTAELNTELEQNVSNMKRAQRQNNTAAAAYDKTAAKVNRVNVKLAGENQEVTKLNLKLNKLVTENTKVSGSLSKVQTALNKTLTSISKVASGSSKLIKGADKLNTKLDILIKKTGRTGSAFKTLDPSIDKVVNSFINLASKSSKLNIALDKTNIKEKSLNISNKTLSQVLATVASKTSSLATKVLDLGNKESKLKTTLDKATSAFKKEKTSMDQVTASAKKQTGALGKLTSSTQKFSSGLFAMTGAFAGPIASAYAFLSVGNRLSTALLTNDNINRQYTASLGDQVEEMDALYDSTLKYMGVSRQEAQETSARIEQQAENYGFAKDAAQEFAVAGTELVGVMSLVNLKGLDMDQTSERVISALRGEAESAEMLGLNLAATNMDKFTKELQDQGVAIDGSFSSLDTATQMQIRFASAIEQAAVITGTSIDPVTDMASAQEALGKISLDSIEGMTEQQKAAIRWKIAINDIKESLRGLGAPLLNIMSIILELAGSIIEIVAPAFELLSKIVLFLGGILQVIADVVIAKFVEIMQAVIDKVQPVVEAFVEWIKTSGVLGVIMAAVGFVINLVRKVIEKVIEVTKHLVEVFKEQIVESETLQLVQQTLGEILQVVITIIGSMIKNTINIIKQIRAWWQESEVADSVMRILEKAVQLLVKAITAAIQIVQAIWTAIGPLVAIVVELTGQLLNALVPAFTTVIEIIGKVIEKILDFLLPAFDTFIGFMNDSVLPMLQSFNDWVTKWIIGPLDAVIGKIQDVIGWFGNLFDKSEETAAEASANADAAKGTQTEAATQAAGYMDRYTAALLASTGRAYSNISKPQPLSYNTTTYNRSSQNVTFQVTGGYRKSLHELQRDAQVTARRKGVALR